MTTGKRNRYLSGLGFTDLLFNTLIGFVFLFVIAFLLIAPPVPTDKKIDPKAEILIILTWPEGSSKDIDMWVRDPTGEVISFRGRDRGLMHLDRDDLGTSKDTITLSDGRQVVSDQNQEIVTIRGFIAGEWNVNIHYYAYRQGSASTDAQELITAPVTVELIRVNPYKQKGLIKYDLIKPGQEKTAFNFTVEWGDKEIDPLVAARYRVEFDDPEMKNNPIAEMQNKRAESYTDMEGGKIKEMTNNTIQETLKGM